VHPPTSPQHLSESLPCVLSITTHSLSGLGIVAFRAITKLTPLQVTLEITSEPPEPQISTAKADKERERHKAKEVNFSKKMDVASQEVKERSIEKGNGDED